MTCIIGLKTNKGVYIGGDNKIFLGQHLCQGSRHRKVFQKGDFLIASSGSCRGAEILNFLWDIPKRLIDKNGISYKSTLNYLYQEVIPSMQKVFKDNEFPSPKSEGAHINDLIFAYEGRLFALQHDFNLSEYDEYVADGCGSEYAYGALFAINNLYPEERVDMALKTAAHFSTHVEGPFTIKFQPKV